MGKKSRRKKERRQKMLEGGLQQPQTNKHFSKKTPFLAAVITALSGIVLFTPLIESSSFYFPFVGPKGLFFMGMVEIMFFLWLALILKDKNYLPRFNSVMAAVSLFLVVLILSALFGVDFSRSFWSKFERMTGILMWLHLFAFFLIISSVFKKPSDWERMFAVSVGVATLIAAMALLEEANVKQFIFSNKNGSTLGNTSFLGTYLLFNAFFALWLFSRKKNKETKIIVPFFVMVSLLLIGIWMPVVYFTLLAWALILVVSYFFIQERGDIEWKMSLAIAVLLSFLAMYLEGARAATGSFLGGLFLILLFYLAFAEGVSSKARKAGKALLAGYVIFVLTMVALLFIPGSFVNKKFEELASQSRFTNWEIAKKAFVERPILGWGPENYPLAFNKYFNPCLFTPKCGGEVWFDRTHNIVFDTLFISGIAGLVSYFILFLTLFFVFWREYFRKKIEEEEIDERKSAFWTAAVFTSGLGAYFIQNLTVFDMVTSLMMFFLIIGFAAFLLNRKKGEKTEKIRKLGKVRAVVLIFLFLVSFLKFVIQPLETDFFVIESLKAKSSPERIKFYEKALTASPLGKYQIREFFGQQSQNFIGNFLRQNKQKLPQAAVENIKKELDFVIAQLKKTEKESPLEYRSILRLANLYNLYYLIDASKLPLAEHYAKKAIALSLNNQQGYWTLAQVRIYQGKFDEALKLAKKTIELEPDYFYSYKVAAQIANLIGREKEKEEIIKEAIKRNPAWENQLKDLMGISTSSTSSVSTSSGGR
jgi:O-antigen ligase